MLKRMLEGLRRFTPTPPRPAGAAKRSLFGTVAVRQGETVPGVYAVWGDVSVDGRVTEDVGCVFGTVTVRGAVEGDVRVLFGSVRVEEGEVGGSVEVGYGKVGLGGDTRVGGNVTVGCGIVRLLGSVRRTTRPSHVGGRTRTNTVTNRAALAEMACLFVVAAVLVLLASLWGIALVTGSATLLGATLFGAAVVATILALIGSFLGGFVLGITAALSRVNTLRRYYECRGGDGCEWVFPSEHPFAGEPIPSEHPFRYYRPFGRTPVLGKLVYDLAERLPRTADS